MFSIRCNSLAKLSKHRKTCRRISKIKSFINKYNWNGIKYPSEKDG